MYCNYCGAPVSSDQVVCSKCGKSTIGGNVAVAARTRVASQIQLLAIFWFVMGALTAIPVVVMGLLSAATAHGRGRFVMGPGPADFPFVFAPMLFAAIGLVLAIVAVLNFVTGWGLLKLRPWARTFALIMGFLALIHPPFGTALGVYTLYVLLPDAAGDEYRRMSSGDANASAA